jgi:hypothetical protein
MALKAKKPYFPPLCKCCSTLPALAFQFWYTSYTNLASAQCSKIMGEDQYLAHISLSPTSPPTSTPHTLAALPLLPATPFTGDCTEDMNAMLAASGPPPHPSTSMSMDNDFPLASANSQASDASPTPGNPWHPPLFEVEVSVFSLLNTFQK